MPKLVLKCGDIDVEYEGTEGFIKEELPKLIKAVAEMRSAGAGGRKAPADTHKGGAGTNASVSTLAQQLSVSNGPDLIVAAAWSLAMAGADSFTKQQLRERAREATAYYKSTYNNNFDPYVARLVKKGRLNHSGGENYALPKNEQTKLEAKLTGS